MKKKFIYSVSAIIFDSPKYHQVLLIQREKNPSVGKWSFAGGRVEEGETISQAMIREAHEETGFSFLKSNQEFMYYSEIPIEDKTYLLFTGLLIIDQNSNKYIKQTPEDLKIKKQFFCLDENSSDCIWNLKEEDCVPNLQRILRTFLEKYI